MQLTWIFHIHAHFGHCGTELADCTRVLPHRSEPLCVYTGHFAGPDHGYATRLPGTLRNIWPGGGVQRRAI